MAPHKFELTDVSESQTSLTSVPGKMNRGCHVSTVVGFILVLLAAAIAVGVGIIVHFAGGNKDVVCQCQLSTNSIEYECIKLAAQGSAEICQACPAKSTSSPPGITGSLSTLAPSPPASTEKPKVKDVRLPLYVYPLHYDVELQPDMHDSDPEKFTFRGSVRIIVRCDIATNNITLHVNVLTVDTSTIRFSPEIPSISGDPQYLGHSKDADRQFFIVILNTNMEVGENYVLEMSFTSPLKNDLKGLYYSEYSRDGAKIYLATTQFQPTDARKAFPCFDEPAIKATFNITLVRPSDRISISNMPITDSTTTFAENGITYVKDVYQKTPKMSTYLLAFVVCDFNYTMNYTNNDVLYRAWATPQSVDQTLYSLRVGVEIIEYYDQYFQINYPLPKQDMIAIPDFAAGAMENWGLITYRETAMLYKDGVSNEANKERVAIVVSHELAHQWFGNLVTPSWWDDLWLNEGFASFVEYMGVDKVHPDWRMFDTFVITDVQNAFKFDGLTSSHPVYVPVYHPDEINEIFDTISYAKGASIIRMMRHFLGEKTFQNGLTKYLNRRSYDSAFHDDLWDALTEQAHVDNKTHINVTNIMDTWVLQMNYPVVTVTFDYGSNDRLHVTQERYLSDRTAVDPEIYKSPFGYRWTIPLTFTSSINPRFDQDHNDIYWLNRDETSKTMTVTDELPASTDPYGWILANVQEYGYYRVNYQVRNWQALGNQLVTNHTVIPIINRAQIINDAWNLVKSGHIDMNIALKTIDYLHKEHDYVPWYAARIELTYVESMLAFTSLYGAFQKFMNDTLDETFRDFGLTTVRTGHVDIATQSLIAGQSCYYGIQSCLDEVSLQYGQWMSNPSHNIIDPNLKNVVYCYGIANGGWEEWEFALKMYKAADVATEKANLLYAMSCSKKAWILNHFMTVILEENSPIRKQDALTVISNVARNNVGRYLAWNFFRGNYDKLKSQFGSSFFAWTNLIGAVTESFNTEFELREVTTFKEGKSGRMGSGERAFQQASEKVSSNIKWMNKNLPIIRQWLKDKLYLSE